MPASRLRTAVTFAGIALIVVSVVLGSNPWDAPVTAAAGPGALRAAGTPLADRGPRPVPGLPSGTSTYSVTVTESGLPLKTDWWVNVSNGVSAMGLTSIHSNAVGFSVGNGSYNFTLASANKDYAGTGGNFTVRGKPVGVSVTFSPVLYSVEFVEKGLPPGREWWANLSNFVGGHSTKSSLVLMEMNGTFSYTVTSGVNYQATGSVTVDGRSPPTVTVHFGPSTTSSPWNLSRLDYEILGGAAAATAVGIAVVLVVRRRKKAPDEELPPSDETRRRRDDRRTEE